MECGFCHLLYSTRDDEYCCNRITTFSFVCGMPHLVIVSIIIIIVSTEGMQHILGLVRMVEHSEASVVL
jgi:hypothetical protein